jgi:hypothetical protein
VTLEIGGDTMDGPTTTVPGADPIHRRWQTRVLRELEPGTPEQFVVKLGRGPEGHERLTRLAAAGVPGITSSDVPALVRGVRRVDIGKNPIQFVPAMIDQFRPSQQRRHALRRDLCQPLSGTVADIRGLLSTLHGRALRASTRNASTEWIGEALHLIQDSYSPAHVARTRGTAGRHPIVYIRYFGLRGRPYPIEHRVVPPPDPRDIVTDPAGILTPWAREAITASREFLRMVARHRARPSAPTNAAELRTFARKHTALSPRRIEPKRYYPSCP